MKCKRCMQMNQALKLAYIRAENGWLLAEAYKALYLNEVKASKKRPKPKRKKGKV